MLITKLKLHAPGVGIDRVLELCDDDLDHLEPMREVRNFDDEKFDFDGNIIPDYRPRVIWKTDNKKDYGDRHENYWTPKDIGPTDDDWLSIVLGANRSGKTLKLKLVDRMFAAMDRLNGISMSWDEDLHISRHITTSMAEMMKGNLGANDKTINTYGIFPVQAMEDDEDFDFFNRIFEDFHWLKGVDGVQVETAESPHPWINPRDYSLSLDTLEGEQWIPSGFSRGHVTAALPAHYKMEGVTKRVIFDDPDRPEDDYAALEEGSGIWRLQALTLTQKYDPDIIHETLGPSIDGLMDNSWEVLKLSDPKQSLFAEFELMVYPRKLWHVIEPSIVQMAERWCDMRGDHEDEGNQKIWKEVFIQAMADANMRAIAYLAEEDGWGCDQAEKWWNENHSERTGRDIRTFDPRGDEYWEEMESRESWGRIGGYAVIPYGIAGGLSYIGGEWGRGLFPMDKTCSYLAADRARENLLDKLLHRRRVYWKAFQRDIREEFRKKYYSSGFFGAGDTVLNVLDVLHKSKVSELEDNSENMVKEHKKQWDDFWSERWEGICENDGLGEMLDEFTDSVIVLSKGVFQAWTNPPSDNPLLWHFVNNSFLSPTINLLYAAQKNEPADFEAFANEIGVFKGQHEGAAVAEIISTFQAFAKRPEWRDAGIDFQIHIVISEILGKLSDWLSTYANNTPSGNFQNLIDEYAPNFNEGFVSSPYDYLVNGLDYRIHCEMDEWTIDNMGPQAALSKPPWDSFLTEPIDPLGGKMENFPGGFEGPTLESLFESLTSGQRHLLEIVFHFAHGKVDLVLIDEPEISLHVALQDELVECLKTESRGGPAIVLATHSPTISGAAIERTFSIDPSFESDVPR